MRKKGLLFLLLGCCLLSGCSLGIPKTSTVNESTSETTKDTEKNGSEDMQDVFEKPVDDSTDQTSVNGGYQIVIDGFKMAVPETYSCVFVDSIGPVVYLDDVFQMKIVVRDISYEEAMKTPEKLTQGTLDAGGEITKELEEIDLDGKKYAYFRMKLEGDDSIVVYTQAADSDKRLCGQIALSSDTVKDEDILHMFAQIMASAVQTDEPNTTAEDIEEQERKASMGEVKESSSLTYKNVSVTFYVPDGYYSQYKDEEGVSYVTENFMSDGFALDVNCDLRDTQDYADAKAFIESQKEWESANADCNIETIDIDGTNYYYIVVHYVHDGKDYQKVYAACDVENGIYSVSANAIDCKDKITVDTIKGFLSVNAK